MAAGRSLASAGHPALILNRLLPRSYGRPTDCIGDAFVMLYFCDPSLQIAIVMIVFFLLISAGFGCQYIAKIKSLGVTKLLVGSCRHLSSDLHTDRPGGASVDKSSRRRGIGVDRLDFCPLRLAASGLELHIAGARPR